LIQNLNGCFVNSSSSVIFVFIDLSSSLAKYHICTSNREQRTNVLEVASRRQDMVFKLYECDCLVDRTKKPRINHGSRLETIEALDFSNQILSNFLVPPPIFVIRLLASVAFIIEHERKRSPVNEMAQPAPIATHVQSRRLPDPPDARYTQRAAYQLTGRRLRRRLQEQAGRRTRRPD
jgi:hypothetical protein